MPDGVIQWFDPATGRAAVVRASHVFPALAGDIESAARHPGARVHFNLQRDHGAEHAVDVRLRPGTRTSSHQRDFGTLAGARRLDSKGPAPFARAHPDQGRALSLHPMEVGATLLDSLQAGHLEAALALYAADAVVHADGHQQVGRQHIASWLEMSGLLGALDDALIRGEGGEVVLEWREGDGATARLRSRIEHGLVAEQWLEPGLAGEQLEELGTTAGKTEVAITTKGAVTKADVTYALERLNDVLAQVEEPILFSRLKLTEAADRARERPALAQVSLDIDGSLVRAHVAAHTMREAADLLQRRLHRQLEERAEHREALRTWSGIAMPGEWRHGDLRTIRPAFFDRPVEERQVVRHKTFSTDEITPDEAAFDMAQLDYDFHLFSDLATGEDSLLERVEDGFQMTRLHPASVDPGPTALSLRVVDLPPPELTLDQAIERMNAGGERCLFFANASSGRGNVIYRRYDGHYGLIVPA